MKPQATPKLQFNKPQSDFETKTCSQKRGNIELFEHVTNSRRKALSEVQATTASPAEDRRHESDES